MNDSSSSLEGDAERLRRTYGERGFVSLPGFLTPDEVAAVNEAKRRFLADVVPSLPAELVYFEDRADPSTLKQVQRLFEHDPFFERMMFRSRFEHLAEFLLGEEAVGKNMQYFNKPAGVGRATPPHQDGFYFMLEPCRALTMWLALEDVSVDQGCIHYVDGSHAPGMREHVASDVLGFSRHIADFGTDHDVASEVLCPCAAGDLIVHDALTIHWAGGNVSRDRSREDLGFIYPGTSARVDEAAHAEYQARLAAELSSSGRI